MSDERTRGGAGPSQQDLRDAVPPSTEGREFRVGVFVILGVLAFFTVLYMMTDPATFRGRYMVETVVESAGGIRKGDPVQMRGVNIGRVHRFEMRSDGQVQITLEIEGEWSIPSDSRTELTANGLIGGVTVAVLPGSSSQPLPPGGEMPGGSAADLFAAAGDLSGQASEVLDRVNRLLNDPTLESVEASVSQLQALLGELGKVTEGQAAQVQTLTRSLNQTARNLQDATGPELSATMASADTAMQSFNRSSQALERATRSLESILARLDRGEGTLGKLTASDSLYTAAYGAAESLRLLLDDIRENPGRYIKLEIF